MTYLTSKSKHILMNSSLWEGSLIGLNTPGTLLKPRTVLLIVVAPDILTQVREVKGWQSDAKASISVFCLED